MGGRISSQTIEEEPEEIEVFELVWPRGDGMAEIWTVTREFAETASEMEEMLEEVWIDNMKEARENAVYWLNVEAEDG
jgi:hypothetical protein